MIAFFPRFNLDQSVACYDHAGGNFIHGFDPERFRELVTLYSTLKEKHRQV